MQSDSTGMIFYINDRVKDTRDNNEGIVYGLNSLNANGVRIRFDNGTKKVYFRTHHQFLIKI